MAISYVGKGAFASGTSGISLTIPSGYQENDLLICLVESANQAVTIPDGWTECPSSPVSYGTANAVGGVRLTMFYKFASSSESTLSVADSGNHTTGVMLCFRGVNQSQPFNASSSDYESSAVSALSCPSVTTTVANSMILNAMAYDIDLATSSIFTNFKNENLAPQSFPSEYYNFPWTSDYYIIFESGFDFQEADAYTSPYVRDNVPFALVSTDPILYKNGYFQYKYVTGNVINYYWKDGEWKSGSGALGKIDVDISGYYRFYYSSTTSYLRYITPSYRSHDIYDDASNLMFSELPFETSKYLASYSHTVTSGYGGGVGFAIGSKATSGSVGNTENVTDLQSSLVNYITLALWADGEVEPSVGNKLKAYNGSAWVEGELKVWNGSAWITGSLKQWNGSEWI